MVASYLQSRVDSVPRDVVFRLVSLHTFEHPIVLELLSQLLPSTHLQLLMALTQVE